ncbi:MAG: kelch repeat-containing protein [Xanthobacteraceae bacterium]
MALVAAGGRIHAIGGRLAGPAERSPRHDVYDPSTDTWTSAAPLPTPRSGVAAVFYDGMILVLGGELPPNHTFPENEAYEAKTDRWVSLAPMPAGRHGFGGAVIGSIAYFVGGSLTPGGNGITDQLIAFSLP